jgi:hypothetical protein
MKYCNCVGMYEERKKKHIATRRPGIAITVLKNELWVFGTLLSYVCGGRLLNTFQNYLDRKQQFETCLSALCLQYIWILWRS